MPLELQAERRAVTGKAVKTLRQRGLIPAVVYGHGVESRSIQLPRPILAKTWKAAGESSLISLSIEKSPPVMVLIHDVQRDPLAGEIIHVDFYQVNLKEKITAKIPLVFEGVAPAVKELGGIFVKNMDHIEVECLPADLVHEIVVNASRLATFNDVLKVSDITIPSALTLRGHPDDVIATVQPPRSEEELKALEEKPQMSVEDVEVVKKDKHLTDEEAVPPQTPDAA